MIREDWRGSELAGQPLSRTIVPVRRVLRMDCCVSELAWYVREFFRSA